MKKTLRKDRVGYTTGVFDMFHIGHLHILMNAKSKCDYLIIGVSSDELVKKYKNKTSIIPYANRKEIIESIKYVDEVVMQSDRDKTKACKELGFDVMFVGDDWKNSELFNKLEIEFKECGSEITYFPYTKEVSSTNFREVLQELYDKENFGA